MGIPRTLYSLIGNWVTGVRWGGCWRFRRCRPQGEESHHEEVRNWSFLPLNSPDEGLEQVP
jgi:hypothetical protein